MEEFLEKKPGRTPERKAVWNFCWVSDGISRQITSWIPGGILSEIPDKIPNNKKFQEKTM